MVKNPAFKAIDLHEFIRAGVVDVVNFYKIPLEKILLIYDDMDLPEGKIK